MYGDLEITTFIGFVPLRFTVYRDWTFRMHSRALPSVVVTRHVYIGNRVTPYFLGLYPLLLSAIISD